ncbi:MAG: DUF4013 domain-containing protein [Halobacteria archaeon]|nr:DUF4013 domain-containing protein [Halobacteria archaeon]
MIEEAIKYPTNREDWIKQYIIGVALIFFFWLIIPALILGGYYVNVLRQTEAGNEELPAFDDFGKLIVDGLKALVIVFVYYLVPTMLFGIIWFLLMGGVSFVSSGTDTGGAVGAGFGLLAILLMLVYFLISLIIGYVLPAALTINILAFTIIGLVFLPFIYHYIYPVMNTLYARGFRKALSS